jgi:hypothetical protein
MTEITRAGIYEMPAEDYHADPVPTGSLSSGGARKLLPPSCPAKFKHWVDNGGDPPKDEFDLGHAVHREVLGVGVDVVVVDAENWQTKAAREARAGAREEGKAPVLTPQWEQVQAMAAAVRAHPEAGALFEPGSGEAEQSIFWPDRKHGGVWRRARPDWIPLWRGEGGRLILPDYKTCASADPGKLSKAMDDNGYDQQAAFYTDAARAMGLAEDVVFLLVCQEKTEPYLITICQPDLLALERGAWRNNRALDLFRRGQETGVWPGYAESVVDLRLPPWAEVRFEQELELEEKHG